MNLADLRVGDRVRLTAPMEDDPEPIDVGATGTIDHLFVVTSQPKWCGRSVFSQIGVTWDNGRTLALCVPPDQFEVIPAPAEVRS